MSEDIFQPGWTEPRSWRLYREEVDKPYRL